MHIGEFASVNNLSESKHPDLSGNYHLFSNPEALHPFSDNQLRGSILTGKVYEILGAFSDS